MRTRTALSFLLIVSFCAAALAAEEPDWLQKARAREGELGALKKVKSTDGFFRAQVPAKIVGKVTPDEGTYVVRMDAKTGAPIECVILQQEQDLARFLVATSEAGYDAIEGSSGKIAAKSIDRVDAGAIDGSPFLAVDWTHRIEPEGKPALVGVLKQLVASKDGHTVYCAHDEVGYARTFRKLAEALIGSLEFADAPEVRPYRAEIATMSLQGMRVGVDQVTYTRDPDGDTKVLHTSAMLVPVDAETLVPADEVMVQWVRPDGTLINAFQIESANGEVSSELKLEPHEDGTWAVAGTYKSKPIEAQLPTGKPSTMLSDVLLLRAKLAAPDPVGSVMKVQTWLPGVDPSRLLESQLEILRAIDDDRFAAKLQMSGIVADLVVDRDGSTVSGTLTMGPMKLAIERVFADGAI